MSTTTITITGHEAITYAEAFNARLQKHADPIEDARDDLTPEEARDVAAEDPSLIFLTLEIDNDLDGDQLAVIEVPERVETETRFLYAGTYVVAMPPEYDWEIVTGEDIIRDPLIRIIQRHGPTQKETIELDKLTRLIREEERARAPGSETILWGEYCERMRKVTGHLPYEDLEDSPTVSLVEAAWWLGAYAAQEAHLHLDDEAPSRPLDGDFETIRDDLGLESRGGGDDINVAIEEGYEWYGENHGPAS